MGNAYQIRVDENRVSFPSASEEDLRYEDGIHLHGHFGHRILVGATTCATCAWASV